MNQGGHRGQPARIRTAGQLCELLDIAFSREQLAAIAAPLEPGVIIAGAGSGKTTVMAARVVWLVGTGAVRPDQVLGLTFTRKAAGELSARIAEALLRAGVVSRQGADDAGEQSVMTYDSFAGRLVGEHGMRIGVDSDRRMITGAARFRVASQVVAHAPGPFDFLPRIRPETIVERVLQLDSEMQAHLVSADQIITCCHAVAQHLQAAPLWRGQPYKWVKDAEASLGERLELLGLVADYQQRKRELGVVEFADQMSVAAQLVQQAPHVGALLRDQYRVVLLDEYQDTSSAQASLLRALFSGDEPASGRGHPVTAVGDPFQAIYGWRGAAVSNVLRFASEFPCTDGSQAASFPLTVNRRSGQKILDVANELAQPLSSDPLLGAPVTAAGARLSTALVAPSDKQGGTVRAASFETWDDEVAWVADAIVDVHRRAEAVRWSDVAVLLRRNADIAPFYAALQDRGVPVEIVGLGGLLRLPEVADVVATLTLLDDETANAALVQLLSGPRWRVGPRDLAALGQRAAVLAQQEHRREHGDGLGDDLRRALADLDRTEIVCLLEAVWDPGDVPISAIALERLARFRGELGELQGHRHEPLLELVRRVITVLGLEVELSSTWELHNANRGAQLALFVDAIGDYVDVDGDASLTGLLAWLTAELEHGEGLNQAVPSDEDSVKLMTVHRAKGLEWDVVFVPALVNTVFPSERVSDNWLKNAAALPAPVRGDADSVPQLRTWEKQGFDRYGDELKESQLHAEDRLAYVATTRARHVLFGSAHNWRSGKTRPNTASVYFEALLHEADRQGNRMAWAPELAEKNPLAGPAAQFEWPAKLDAEHEERLRQAAARVQTALDGQGLAPVEPTTLDELAQIQTWVHEAEQLVAEALAGDSETVQVPLPATLSATALMRAHRDEQAFALELLRPMPRPFTRGADLGTRFHEWVERRFSMTALVELDAEENADRVGESVDTELSLQRLCERFELGPYAERVPEAVEVPFVLVVAGRQIRGRIDAVYRCAEGSLHRWQVVDWKTSDAPADPIQLGLYRLAWAQAQGVPEEQVDAVFYRVLSGVIERPSSVPGSVELRGLVAALGGAGGS